MKKITTLSLVILAAMVTQSKGQTFLVNLLNTSAFGGNSQGTTNFDGPVSDFGLTGSVIEVGDNEGNQGNGDASTYTLGTVGTLSLPAYSGYGANGGAQFGGNGGDYTNPEQLTGRYIDNAFALTLTLTGVPAGDTVTLSGIGSDTANNTPVLSVNGTTGAQIAGANSDGSGTFTQFYTGTATAGETFSIAGSEPSNAAYGSAEADLTGILVTITAPSVSSTPEPSTWAMLLSSFAALFGFTAVRRRSNS